MIRKKKSEYPKSEYERLAERLVITMFIISITVLLQSINILRILAILKSMQ